MLNSLLEACVPYVVSLLHWTPTFEWLVATLVVKYGHQIDTCYNKIELCVQNLDILLSSIVNTVDKAYAITHF